MNILHPFWLAVKIGALFFRLGKNAHMSHLCPMSTQILNYINIFDINEKLLSHECNIFCVG